MDRKTGLVLTLAKYGAYMTVLWICLSNSWLDLEGPRPGNLPAARLINPG